MFIVFACITLGIITLIALRDWSFGARFSSRIIQKSLKSIYQLIHLKKWDLALKELAPLIKNGKGGKEVALLEIQVLRGLGQFEEALHKIEEAHSKYSEELLFYREKGLILLLLGDPAKALSALQGCASLLRSEPDLFAYASACLGSFYPQECIDLLSPFLENTQNGQLVALAADAYYELKQFQRAIHCYTQALSLGYPSHRLYCQMGHSYRRLGNLLEAENIFRTLLNKDSSDIEAILGIGACLQEREQYTKAFFMYQTGLTWFRDPRLLNKAAYTALRTHRFRKAESYFCEIMDTQEPEPLTMAYFGLCLESQKKWQEAEQNYLKMIELFPDCHHGYRALAWLFGVGLSQTLSQDQGLNYAHRALKLHHDLISLEILSACAARTGAFDKAYHIQLSLAKQDKSPDEQSRRQQALRTLRKGLPLHDQQVVRSLVA